MRNDAYICSFCLFLSYINSHLIQWNLSKMDTIGTEESVPNKEVSSFQGLNYV